MAKLLRADGGVRCVCGRGNVLLGADSAIAGLEDVSKRTREFNNNMMLGRLEKIWGSVCGRERKAMIERSVKGPRTSSCSSSDNLVDQPPF
jgi:hypothetical protein